MVPSPPTSPARRRGRPNAKAASTNQRALLLDAALALFAQRGIAATSLNAITSHAEVTPALVHYYFASRQRLLDAVIEERLLPILDQVMAPIAQYGDDPRATILKFSEHLFNIVASTPWLPALWVREILSDDGQLREFLLKRIAPSIAAPLRELSLQAQAQGLINQALDPGLMMVSLIGLTIFPLAAAPIWRQLPGNETIDTQTLARHMLSLLARGLEPAHELKK